MFAVTFLNPKDVSNEVRTWKYSVASINRRSQDWSVDGLSKRQLSEKLFTKETVFVLKL